MQKTERIAIQAEETDGSKTLEAQTAHSLSQLRHHSLPCPHTRADSMCSQSILFSLLQYYHTLLKLLPTCPEPLLELLLMVVTILYLSTQQCLDMEDT